ncbi:MAG: hypothetical protein Q7T80_17500 [Methanoregula sp.]|nr:hypothetical protein [Methanoregula sp.]
MILAIDKLANINTENTIVVVERAIQEYGSICLLRERIMDHGGKFDALRRDENGDWDSEFKQYLGTHNIRPILARVKHPQTTGKIEKCFDTYKRFLYEFALSMNSLSDTITCIMAALISIISNLRNARIGVDYPKRPLPGSVSVFLVGELMKRSSYLKLKFMRNSFRTVQDI